MSEFSQFIQVCQELADSRSEAHKIELIQSLDKVGQTLLFQVYCPFHLFNIKEASIKKMNIIPAEKDAGSFLFFQLLENLHTQRITGHRALQEVNECLNQYTALTIEWLKKVIKKDLKIGVGVATINKAIPNFIPSFKAMKGLAHKDGDLYNERKLTEIKYDGQRTVCFVYRGNPEKNIVPKVEYRSYDGNDSWYWNGLFDEQLISFADFYGVDCVVETEVVGKNYSRTMRAKKDISLIKEKEKINQLKQLRGELAIKIFDVIPMINWHEGKYDVVQLIRTQQIQSVLKCMAKKGGVLYRIEDGKKVNPMEMTEYKVTNSHQEVVEFYGDALKKEFEGVMIKNVDGLYEWKRSSNWVKWKPIITLDLQIVGFYEGEKGSMFENSLGGFLLSGTDENGRNIKTDCGGFVMKNFLDWMEENEVLEYLQQNNLIDEFIDLDIQNLTAEEQDLLPLYEKVTKKEAALRKYIWLMKDNFYGKTLEIKAQELTKAENSDHYSVRFAKALNFRTDK